VRSASSGQTTRHGLNRGGDRALNKAIHIIATTRIRSDPATGAYITRVFSRGETSLLGVTRASDVHGLIQPRYCTRAIDSPCSTPVRSIYLSV
jgi:Transposase IS116/IS110/IS902 family